jgi:uncharacterized protein (DUF1697 family)
MSSCWTEERDLVTLRRRIEKAVEKTFGFHSDVILRTCSEMREVIARNPFAARRDIHSSRLLVTFLARDPGPEVRDKLRHIKTDPEEFRIHDSELYTFYPNGMGRSKMPWAAIEKILQTPGTARNWNSVTNLLAIGQKLEAALPTGPSRKKVQHLAGQ